MREDGHPAPVRLLSTTRTVERTPGEHMTFDENEPQAVRDHRFAEERAQRRARRRAAPVELGPAHFGAGIVAVALALLGWFGKFPALGVVGGVFLLWFAVALVWIHADGDRGGHAFQRAYRAAFGWSDML